MKINRRTFLVVLGATATATAAAQCGGQRHTRRLGSNSVPLYYFATACSGPAACPRTAAITYLPLPPS